MNREGGRCWGGERGKEKGKGEGRQRGKRRGKAKRKEERKGGEQEGVVVRVGRSQKVEEGKEWERGGKMGGGDREKGEEWDKVKVYIVCLVPKPLLSFSLLAVPNSGEGVRVSNVHVMLTPLLTY